MESLMRSMLGRDEEFVLERLQSFIKNEEKVKSQEQEIDSIKDDIDDLKEENHQLNNKLENKRDVIDDMEIELNGYERKFEDAKKAVILKEIEVDELERVIYQQSEEIKMLKDNNDGMISQISENVRMEKKIFIQNGIIEEIKGKLYDVKELEETNLRDIDAKNEELKTEVANLEKEVKELEEVNKEKINMLESIEAENKILKDTLREKKDENNVDDDELFVGKEFSLLEIFGNAFPCKLCNETFWKRNELKSHVEEQHREVRQVNIWNDKLSLLEAENFKQKSLLFSSLLNLKETEERSRSICQCKSFCKIRHVFYNWSKPKSEELLKKSKAILGIQVDAENIKTEEFEEESFQCEHCESCFVNSRELKKHSEEQHSIQNLQTISSNPWGLAFFDFGQ